MFTPLNEADNALLALRTLELEDGQAIDEFHAKFNELIKKSRVNDINTSLAYYKVALPSWLRRKVATSYPVPTNIFEWIGRARDIHEAERVDRNIGETLRYRRPQRRTTPKKVRRNIQDPAEMPVTSASADINKMTTEERSRHMQDNLCFFCHKPGHVARACPNRVRRGKPGRKVARKVRQVSNKDIESNTEETETEDEEEESSDSELQVEVIQADMDSYDTDF